MKNAAGAQRLHADVEKGSDSKARQSDQAEAAESRGRLNYADTLLLLQRSAGNHATGTYIARKFAPYTVNDTTHLRKGGVDKQTQETKAKTGFTGRTGSNLKVGQQLVVDTDQKSGAFSRAVKVDHDTWDEKTAIVPAMFVRTAKLTPAAQPDGSGKYFHHKFGPMEHMGGPTDMSPGGLFRRAPRSPIFVKIGPGGVDLTKFEELTLGDHKAIGHLEDMEAKSDDDKDMYGLTWRTGFWLKASGDDELVTPMTTRSATEKMRCYEGSQKKLSTERKNLAEQLGAEDGKTTTVDVPYKTKNGKSKATVKVTGKKAAAHYAAQKAAIVEALRQIAPRNVPIADGMEFVISSTLDPRLKNEAVHTGAGVIFLRGNIFDHKVVDDVDQTSTDIRGGKPQDGILGVCHHIAARAGAEAQAEIVAVSTIIHEIGHVIHRTNKPALFEQYRLGLDWEDEHADESKQNTALAKKVSHYAWNAGAGNVTELVAEVFTGIMNGEKYDREVIDAYLKYGGTKTWTKDSDVVEKWTPSDTKTGV